jgi:hypothetical protein
MALSARREIVWLGTLDAVRRFESGWPGRPQGSLLTMPINVHRL